MPPFTLCKLKEWHKINVLFIGDIVGSIGRDALRQMLPYYREKYKADFIIVNGENAAGGRGITHKIASEMFSWGIDGITLGNHTWANKDVFDFIDDESRVIRPANFPDGTPGQGFTTLHANGKSLTIINLQGRSFMTPIDCPFAKAQQIIEQLNPSNRCILVDFHAEATSEKVAMGWYLDGHVSAVVGTHTHVQTHDETILPQGTAYVTDVGMVGSSEGVLGVERETVINRFKTQLPARFTQAAGKWFFHGVTITLDESSGQAKKIKLIRRHEDDVIFD